MSKRKKPKPEAASEPFVIYPPGSRIGSNDRVSPPSKVQLLVSRYPGSAVHGTRLGMNHYGPTGAATAIRKYVAAYILDSTGDEFDRIFADRNWKTTSQPAD